MDKNKIQIIKKYIQENLPDGLRLHQVVTDQDVEEILKDMTEEEKADMEDLCRKFMNV